ncbi:hypothetical protein [Methylobacterium frigidaeris]|uniref:Uncharacterized protein n=1 Tax=Methylobacterium frigidaeris TaxID=2038277 RepID=A0AA37M3J0_9HYPH|nr:hypothetical protein [Methylobacterium frigidaeris]GJD60864.1 hypothetical protein MPEAHAMD_1004 [Methylobacterium frigidaeris]
MNARYILPVVLLTLTTNLAAAQGAGNAYEYAGSHAGGPADALIPNGVPAPIVPVVRSPAYRYSGSHAGGPADALIPDGVPAPVVPVVRSPAYRYSGSHAGGPADALIRD